MGKSDWGGWPELLLLGSALSLAAILPWWRTVVPGADKTGTMLTVAMLGNIVAAFVGGGMMGRMIFDQPRSPG